MSDWLIVVVAVIAAIIFLLYKANQEPEFNPPPVKPPVKMDLTQ